MISYLLGALSGVLYVLSFPGLDLWPLSMVALLPVLHAVDRRARSGWQALGIGLAFGTVTQLLGFHWLIGTLRVFSALPTIGCVLVYALFCVYQAGQLALFVMLLWLGKRNGRDPWLLAPFCYGAVELVYPLLFPSYFAASLHDAPWLLQSLDLGGPSLVSMLLVAINAALYRALSNAVGSSRSALRPIASAALLLSSMAGYGALRSARIEGQMARAQKLAVGIVQANMGTFQKREARAEGRRRYLEQSAQLEQQQSPGAARARRPELLIWPETALQFVLPTELKDARPMLGALTTPVLFGGLGHRIEHGHAQLFNSAFLADANGHVLGRSDKLRLIPFAEYIPFGDRIPALYDFLPNSGQFTTGDGPRALVLGKTRIAALICYEDVLPAFVREVANETNPHLLVNLSNDAWFGHSAEPYIHLALSQLRAIEQRRYLVRASNSGISAVIDPLGRVVEHTAVFTRASLRADVALLSGSTWYRRLGDWPGWLGLVLSLWAASPIHVRRRRQ